MLCLSFLGGVISVTDSVSLALSGQTPLQLVRSARRASVSCTRDRDRSIFGGARAPRAPPVPTPMHLVANQLLLLVAIQQLLEVLFKGLEL